MVDAFEKLIFSGTSKNWPCVFQILVVIDLVFSYLDFIYRLEEESSMSANSFLNHFLRFHWISSQEENIPAASDNK